MSNGPILYPNVTSMPGQGGIADSERIKDRKQDGALKGEFDQVFNKTLGEQLGAEALKSKPDLNQVKSAIKFSAHATQRLRDRNIKLEQALMTKVSDAISKAEAKGVQDTLVLTKDAALIVNVPNRTVITALDRNQLDGNVFTNIDGAVVV